MKLQEYSKLINTKKKLLLFVLSKRIKDSIKYYFHIFLSVFIKTIIFNECHAVTIIRGNLIHIILFSSSFLAGKLSSLSFLIRSNLLQTSSLFKIVITTSTIQIYLSHFCYYTHLHKAQSRWSFKRCLKHLLTIPSG